MGTVFVKTLYVTRSDTGLLTLIMKGNTTAYEVIQVMRDPKNAQILEVQLRGNGQWQVEF